MWYVIWKEMTKGVWSWRLCKICIFLLFSFSKYFPPFPSPFFISWIKMPWSSKSNFLFSRTCLAQEFGLVQGGRSWQPFGEGKNGHKSFCLAYICYFRDKCVVFAPNCKFANSIENSENVLQFMSDLFIPLTASWSSFLYLFPGAFVMVWSTCYVKEIFPFCQAQNFEAFLCTLHKTIFSAFSSSCGFFFFLLFGDRSLDPHSTPARGLEPLRPRLDVGVDWGARTQLRQSLVLSIGP